MTWKRTADVVVVGSGAAGIIAALAAASGGASVLMITKDLTGGATPLAQGGLAAAIGVGDTTRAHAHDTEIAGSGLCEPDAVAALAAGAPGAVEWLVSEGARLERGKLRLEGGHSRNRIVHSGDDATGAEVHRALLGALLASRIEILDRTVALDLVMRDNAAGGLMAGGIGPGGALDPGLISARAVVLAAGGLGQAFATTTNPPGATGDALAIAARAGAEIRDPEFVQFHPTVLWREDATGQCPLITEALRGAGAVLRDLDGEPLMAGHDPRGDLAPRDVVAARIHEVISAKGGGHVWLDATGLGRDILEDGFPTVTAACRKYGIDPVTELIAVAPGAHYSCGGIRADLDGRTSIPGLYAVGETASTGVHGANRLASNSLVEAIIAGRLAGENISRGMSGELDAGTPRTWTPDPRAPGPEAGAYAAARPVLAAAMSRYAGVMRDAEGLARLARIIDGTPSRSACSGGTGALSPRTVRNKGLDLGTVEAANLHAVSALIAAAARRRTESRGCHRRRDAPRTAADARHTLARWDGVRIEVNWEEA
jgi:L-aspartate oxidase